MTVTQGKIKPKKVYYCTSTSSDGEGKGGVCRRWRAAQAFILSTGRLESLQPFNVSVRPSVRHNWKAFKTLKNNRKKAGPFSVGTEAAVSDR